MSIRYCKNFYLRTLNKNYYYVINMHFKCMALCKKKKIHQNLGCCKMFLIPSELILQVKSRYHCRPTWIVLGEKIIINSKRGTKITKVAQLLPCLFESLNSWIFRFISKSGITSSIFKGALLNGSFASLRR